MDAPQWPQGVGVGVVRGVDETESSRTNSEKIFKKARTEKEEAAAALNCPRCNSSNTKFCYYNNYSLSQPRYLCKSCRRYWTAGGTLRNVPVGGNSRRKNKRRYSNSSSSSFLSISTIPDVSPQKISPQNPKIQEGRDLNLPYNHPPLYYNGISELVALPLPFTLDPQNPSFDHLFKTGGLSSLVSGSDSNSVISSGFQLGNLQDQDDSSRIIFPSDEYEFEHERGLQRHSNGFWSGMLSGGSW